MLSLILLLLIFFWLLGHLSFPLTGIGLFRILGRIITLNDILVFIVILWLIEILPNPFRKIATVFFILWLLSAMGIIAIAGFSNLILIAFIIALIVYIYQGWY